MYYVHHYFSCIDHSNQKEICSLAILLQSVKKNSACENKLYNMAGQINVKEIVNLSLTIVSFYF